MKVKLLALAGVASLLVGCVDPYGRPNYTGSGALIGGASGALLGASIDRRNPGAGALIGGAAGLLTGSLIGNSMDHEARPRYYPPPPVYPAVPPPPTGNQPTVADIARMTREGLSEDVILSQITTTRAVYHLDSNAIIDLKNAGVSQKVITVMINSNSEVVVTQSPPVPQQETIIVSPGPDFYWCGGEWVWNGVGWVWVGGRWIARPYHGAIWIETRWERGPRGWYRRPGYWR